MIQRVLAYLGYPVGAVADVNVLHQVHRAVQEVEAVANFQYRYAQYEKQVPFLQQNPAYQQYLAGATGYLLCATTLGVQVDRHLKRMQMKDMAYAVVFDAAASVYLEMKADAFENSLPMAEKGYRFCPGYAGTPLSDNRMIAQMVRAEQIGITFLDSGLMVPMKSMVGIVRLGGQSRKSCADCVAASACRFRAHNTTCWK